MINKSIFYHLGETIGNSLLLGWLLILRFVLYSLKTHDKTMIPGFQLKSNNGMLGVGGARAPDHSLLLKME